jgi:hypothetical protein
LALRLHADGQRHVVVANLCNVTAWYRTEQVYRTLFIEMDDGFLLVEKTGNTPDADIFIVPRIPPCRNWPDMTSYP